MVNPTLDTAALLYDVRVNGLDDPFAVCMVWWFAIADEIHSRGDMVPADWQYRPRLGSGHPDPGSWEAETVAEYPTDVLREAGDVLCRWRGFIEIRGQSY